MKRFAVEVEDMKKKKKSSNHCPVTKLADTSKQAQVTQVLFNFFSVHSCGVRVFWLRFDYFCFTEVTTTHTAEKRVTSLFSRE